MIEPTYLCDASHDPEHFSGTRAELREHQKVCEDSEVGQLYRTLAFGRENVERVAS